MLANFITKKVIKKAAKKKVIKKVKKIVSAKGGKKVAKKATKSLPKRKPIGEVVHFFDKICVAVVKFKEGVAVGEELCFEGPKESFNQVLNSMLSYIKTKDVVILDEPTEGFASEQIDKMRDIFEQLNAEQIILVSHEEKMEGFVTGLFESICV